MARYQLDVPPQLVQLSNGYGIAEGYALTHTLLALPTPPTAIFAKRRGHYAERAPSSAQA